MHNYYNQKRVNVIVYPALHDTWMYRIALRWQQLPFALVEVIITDVVLKHWKGLKYVNMNTHLQVVITFEWNLDLSSFNPLLEASYLYMYTTYD